MKLSSDRRSGKEPDGGFAAMAVSQGEAKSFCVIMIAQAA